jgi:rfaE bifunctional protein nucleotidyltransferase chain/domain
LGQVISQDNLILQRQIWKGNGQSVVFVSGCFDLLHPGHIRLLEQARSYGDLLVVGVRSDSSVRAETESSGSNGSAGVKQTGPITPGLERAEVLAELAAVDYVVEFDEESPAPLISKLSPEIVVETAGRDSRPVDTQRPGASAAAQAKTVRILREPGYSTEQLLTRIAQSPRSPA